MLDSFRALVNGGPDWAMNALPNPILLAVLAVVIAVFSYFLGCSNGAIIVSKYILHNDVRNHGSGNAGLTNFHRVFGGKLTLVVILSDVVKAIVAICLALFAVWLVGWPGLSVGAKYWAGLWCLLGHMFPCMFGFKGGKGILSGGAIAIMMDWRIFVIGFSLFLIIVFATHYVSLGSILAATAYAVLFVIFFPGQPWIWSIAIAMAVLAIFMHRSNIARLLHGTETKTYLLKSKKK